MKLNTIDLFCGAGGLSLGFEDAGFDSVLAIDLWEDAIKTFNHNRKNKVGIVKDISSINQAFIKKNIGNKKIHGVVGGPPCQGFSMAGSRSIKDLRNQLYKDYFKVLKIINPDFFVLENVTGILTLDNGNFRKRIMHLAKESGYKVSVDKLVASEHGVPQKRIRVFFIGIKTSLDSGRYVFPNKKNYVVTAGEALSDLPSLTNRKKATTYRFSPKNNYQKSMRGNQQIVLNHENSNHTKDTVKTISLIPEGGSIKDLNKKQKGDRTYMSLLRRVDRKRPSNTIDTGHRTYFHYKENRVLSVREAARLQSFPDNYEFLGKKQAQYKQVGNAVPPLLAKEVAKSIKKYLY